MEKTSQKILVSVLIGLILSIVTGIIGAGGGVMILIVLIFILGFPLQKAIGTSALIMAITTFSGFIGYAIHGNIDVLSGIIIGIGAVVAGIGSARFANKIDEKSLGRVVASIFIILGLFLTFLTII
ncbi:sulfite exporter TauE/SafE family protein [Candidatus Methanoliparum sp. LAM-1]|uniref:sulfite exporter TauE/SafE family protein n=1 Tax=Candidatus Methanoliparum sp. LAM-1 TaxID=2874846 RepID=UPI00226D00C5|nr:sulfite exporter TauE/SafE family protein [Candidatus Methanoliparum sp. LAM-1]